MSLLVIFADQVLIDPTFSGRFVCCPVQSFNLRLMFVLKLTNPQTYNKGHTYTNPWPGQFLTPAQSHTIQAVGASRFALIGTQQHGIVVKHSVKAKLSSKVLYYRGDCQVLL